MFELCPTYTDTSAYTTTPLADSGINDRLVKLRSLIHHTCFEFIDVSFIGAVNFLLQNTPDAVVNWFKFWRIRRPQCRRYEIGCLLLQVSDCVAILLKHKKTRPGITGVCVAVTHVQVGCCDSILHSL